MRRQCQITPSIRAHLEESCPFKTSLLFVIASFQLSLILHKCQIRLHKTVKNTLALFRVSIFGAAQGWAGEAKRSPLPKICHTYPTMMRPGTVVLNVKKIKKYMSYVTHHLSSAVVSFFPLQLVTCYIKKYRYRLHFNT